MPREFLPPTELNVDEAADQSQADASGGDWRAQDLPWHQLRKVPRQHGWALVALSLGMAPRVRTLKSAPPEIRAVYRLRRLIIKRSASASEAKGMLQYETDVEARTKDPAKGRLAENRYYDVVTFVDFFLQAEETLDARLLAVAEYWRQKRAPDETDSLTSGESSHSAPSAGVSTPSIDGQRAPSANAPLRAGTVAEGSVASRYDGLVPGLLVMYLMSLAEKKKPPPPALLRPGGKTLFFSALADELRAFVGERLDEGGGDTHSTLRHALSIELKKANRFFHRVNPSDNCVDPS